jgi:2-polyprenyl-3-methyl-5-hydroxy-6-metoxy-1,4-benzoquinol methylase/uncharacterized membrane protein YbhN (UPF0104 family)
VLRRAPTRSRQSLLQAQCMSERVVGDEVSLAEADASSTPGAMASSAELEPNFQPARGNAPAWRRKPVRLLLLVTASLTLAWIVRHSDIRVGATVDALRSFSQAHLAIAIAFVLLQAACQSARFAIVVPRALGVGSLRALRVTTVGQLLNVVLPARGGDVYKLLALCPSDRAGARAQALGVIAADKAADVLGLTAAVLLLGLGPALHLLGTLRESSAEFICVGLIAAVACLLVAKWRSSRIVARFTALVTHVGTGLAAARSPMRATGAVSLGTVAWLSEAAALAALARGVGCAVSPSQALFGLLALNISIAVPVLPANLGAFEAGVVLGLRHAGVSPGLGLAIALAHHGIELAVTALFGSAGAILRALARPRVKSAFLVRNSDKIRALSHYENSSQHYEKHVQRGPLRLMRDRERASVLRLLGPLHAGNTFLDVGCGGGFYALHAKRAAMSVCAVDAAPGMIERLTSRVDEALVCDVETLQLANRTFDRVVCAGVLDFVAKPELAIANLMRHVAPGGALVILAPRTGWGGFYYRLEKLAVGLRINRYTPAWFSDAASRAGFHLTSLDLPLPHNLVVRLEPAAPRITK